MDDPGSVRTPGVCVCKGGPVTLWPWRGGEVIVLFLNVSLRGHWLFSMHIGQRNTTLC